MRRRLLVVASFATLLVACASILGDFDVEPAGSNPDASSLTDGSSSSGDLGEGGSSSSGGVNEGGTEGGHPDLSPTGLQVATSTSATCATVQYPSGKKVTYCWGAQGGKYPFATVGAANNDPNVEGFYRPRLPSADVKYLTFSYLMGAGTGEWFVGRGTDGQATATYAWGSNDTGETAAGAATPVMPTVMKFNGSLLQFDTIYAAPQHGCMVQNQNFYCWGNDTNCEIRSGAAATCNAETPPLVTTSNNARAVEDEGAHTSGKNGPVLRMAGGLDHSCREVKSSETGVDAMDEITCWGSNAFAQVDIASSPNFVDAPFTVTKIRRAGGEIAAGENHTCAITDVSKITCWGRNDSGQANPANPSSKVKTTDVNVPGTLSTVRAAGDLSCVVAKAVGQPSHAFCWGAGPKGRAPAETDLPIAKVAGIQDVTELAIGRAHACAVAKKEGATDKDPARVFCWGSNANKRIDTRSDVSKSFDQPFEIVFPPEPAN